MNSNAPTPLPPTGLLRLGYFVGQGTRMRNRFGGASDTLAQFEMED